MFGSFIFDEFVEEELGFDEGEERIYNKDVVDCMRKDFPAKLELFIQKWGLDR